MTEYNSSLIGQRQQRLDKVKKLKELGINPYPAEARKEADNQLVVDEFSKYEEQELTLTGRVKSIREHGQLVFYDLEDESGSIQVYLKKDELEDTDTTKQILGFEHIDLLDTGDFLQVKGKITKTQRGEPSILAHELKLLTKAIRPLPTDLGEKEDKFRRRYLDLALNKDSQEIFHRKAKFWQASREFLQKEGFEEVEVPVLEHVTGGADANPFITYHDFLDQNFYLRISTELYQKRLIGGGLEKVFTLGPNFRNEGLSDEHLQEYYQLEWYWAYANYRDNIELVKKLFTYLAKEVYGQTKFSTRGHTFDLADEWEEIDYVQSIRERFDIDIFQDKEQKMYQKLQQEGVDIESDANRMRLIDNLWKVIRKEVAGPAILLNEPAFMSPLAKSRPDAPELTERFHVILAGSELGNGYSELNDPLEQLERFKEQQQARDAGDEEAQMLDIDFVEMLEYGMPPTSGYGQSERVFWFFEDLTSREGTLFPQLKYHISDLTKKIYPDVDLEETSSYTKATREADAQHSVIKTANKKIVLIVNQDLEGWQLTNVIGHLSTYLGTQAGKELQNTATFAVGEEAIPANITNPIITMKAKSSEQLYNLLHKVEEEGITHLAFIKEMMDYHSDEEIQETIKNKNRNELQYLGIGLFGESEEVDKLTKKFSLWR